MIDYIIDDIPDHNLKNQARLHNFAEVENLLKALEKVSLKSRQNRLQAAVAENPVAAFYVATTATKRDIYPKIARSLERRRIATPVAKQDIYPRTARRRHNQGPGHARE